jgi:hypothetical protein
MVPPTGDCETVSTTVYASLFRRSALTLNPNLVFEMGSGC